MADLGARTVDISLRRSVFFEAGLQRMLRGYTRPARPGAAAAARCPLSPYIHYTPGRLAGLAALPMQDPALAAVELRRAVRELGLLGGYGDEPYVVKNW